MGGPDPQQSPDLVTELQGSIEWNELFLGVLRLRAEQASGTLTITVRGFSERIRFQAGQVVAIEPTPGNGDLESVARRLRALVGLRQGEIQFEPSPHRPGMPGFDPAGPVLSWFDSERASAEQATHLGERWAVPLVPGPNLEGLAAAFAAAYGGDTHVIDGLRRGASISDLMEDAEDALLVLQQVYAARTTEMAFFDDEERPRHEAAPASDVPGPTAEWIGLEVYGSYLREVAVRPAATAPVSIEPVEGEGADADAIVITARPEDPVVALPEMPEHSQPRAAADLGSLGMGFGDGDELPSSPDGEAEADGGGEPPIEELFARALQSPRGPVAAAPPPVAAAPPPVAAAPPPRVAPPAPPMAPPRPGPLTAAPPPRPPLAPPTSASQGGRGGGPRAIITPPPPSGESLTFGPDPLLASVMANSGGPGTSEGAGSSVPAAGAAPVVRHPSRPPVPGLSRPSPAAVTRRPSMPPASAKVEDTPAAPSLNSPGAGRSPFLRPPGSAPPVTARQTPSPRPRPVRAGGPLPHSPRPVTADDLRSRLEASRNSAGQSPEQKAQAAALAEWLTKVEAAVAEKDHYGTLGVEATATDKQIQERRTEWIRKYHPDLFRNTDLGELKQRLDVAWKAINNATSILSSPEKRREYDIYTDRKRRGLPTDPQAIMRAEELFREGERFLKGHKYREAKSCFEKALQLNPVEQETIACHVWCDYIIAKADSNAGLGLREQTKQALEKCAAEAPNLVRARFYLGCILRDEGRKREALHYFQEAVQIDAYHVDAKREIRLLQSGATEEKKKRGVFGFGKK